MMRKTEGLFAVLVDWSVSYALAKKLLFSAFMGKWPTVISLIHLEDELSFKEMRMCGQYKISFCCICDWCESREMGGRGSVRLPTPMVESFSADLLPAIKSYWAESPFELLILLGE